MRRRNQAVWLVGLSAGALTLLGPVSSASAVELGADDELRYVQRDLVMPEMTLTPFADLRVLRFDGGGVIYSQNIGVRFVLIENLEIRANPFSFYAADASGYGTASLGGTYRFYNDDTLEVGVSASVPVGSTGALGGIGMSGGLPVRLHVDDAFRLDTGFFITGLFDTNFGGDPVFGLARVDDAPILDFDPALPVEATVQIIDEVFAGLDTGFGIASFDQPGDRIFVPLGFRVGANLEMDGRPFADLTTGFRWPVFINTANNDTVEAGTFEVQIIRADLHFDVSDG